MPYLSFTQCAFIASVGGGYPAKSSGVKNNVAVESSPSHPQWPLSWTYPSIVLGGPQCMMWRTLGASMPMPKAIVAMITRKTLSGVVKLDNIQFLS